MRAIIVRCAFDLIRKRRPKVALEKAEEGITYSRDEKRQEDRRRLEQALSRISALDREIILALNVDGKSVEEVAGEFSMTKIAVRVRAYRARKKLCKILMEEL